MGNCGVYTSLSLSHAVRRLGYLYLHTSAQRKKKLPSTAGFRWVQYARAFRPLSPSDNAGARKNTDTDNAWLGRRAKQQPSDRPLLGRRAEKTLGGGVGQKRLSLSFGVFFLSSLGFGAVSRGWSGFEIQDKPLSFQGRAAQRAVTSRILLGRKGETLRG